MKQAAHHSEPATLVAEPSASPEFGDRHAVFGERSGLVRAQDRRRPECFDGGRTSRQNAGLRNPPRAHRHEDGKDNGEFLGQHRHANRDTCQDRVKPAASQGSIEHDDENADARANQREDADELARLGLKVRGRCFEIA